MKMPIKLAKRGTIYTLNRYKKIFNKNLLIDGDPHTFTNFLFRFIINMHWRDISGLTKAVDKLHVRAYVTARLGSEFLNEVAWAGDAIENCPMVDYACGDWILKTNHGSGGHAVIKRDSISMIRDKIKTKLTQNYYFQRAEPQYFFVKPKAFIEKLVRGEESESPLMLRFWCFKGSVVLIQADDGSPVSPFYNREWRDMKISRVGGKPPESQIDKPKNLEEAISTAEKLSNPFYFVRVDLYNEREEIRFSELTFTPMAGTILFSPLKWDYRLAQILTQGGKPPF